MRTSILRRRSSAEAEALAGVSLSECELGPWLVAGALALVGAAALAAALLFGTVSDSDQHGTPPPIVAAASTPAPAAVAETGPAGTALVAPTPTPENAPARASQAASSKIVAHPSARQQQLDATRFVDATQTHIAARWMEAFDPIYATAQRTFGVNWLLIASIHRQESAFSTAPGTYTGLNFAGCCGGPMQFNVTNGPVPTWRLVSGSFRYGRRPASYDHPTPKHPSIYDDFDSIMAAAHLLSADGATYRLDFGAWSAAYDYYGHDATGIAYADRVLARAIGWSQHGFCINCGTETRLVEAVHAAYGGPVLAGLVKASAARAR
jgi:hypothetical protein